MTPVFLVRSRVESTDLVDPLHHVADAGIYTWVVLFATADAPRYNSDLFPVVAFRDHKWATAVSLKRMKTSKLNKRFENRDEAYLFCSTDILEH